jgi:hypothetical protein
MAGLVMAAGKGMAQTIDKNIIKVVPHYLDELSEVDFLAQTQPLKEEPLGDKFLSYQMRMPLGWTKSTSTEREGLIGNTNANNGLSARILGIVTKYYGPNRIDNVDFFQIEAMNLDYELSVRNWFLNYVFTRGFTLQGMEKVGEQAIEAQYVTLVDDAAYVFRVRAEANGPRVVLISYAVPEKYWEKERGMQERVIRSFQFLSPEKSVNQNTRTYAFLDLLRFDYPAGWRLIAPNIYSTDGMDAKLISTQDKKTVSGEIDLRIISTELDTSLAEEVGYLKEDIQERGLKIGSLIEVLDGDFTFKDHILYNRVEVYEAKDESRKIQDHEMWLAVLVEDRYYYIITMLTPGRNSDFYTWAKNSEAFQVVVESLRP